MAMYNTVTEKGFFSDNMYVIEASWTTGNDNRKIFLTNFYLDYKEALSEYDRMSKNPNGLKNYELHQLKKVTAIAV